MNRRFILKGMLCSLLLPFIGGAKLNRRKNNLIVESDIYHIEPASIAEGTYWVDPHSGYVRVKRQGQWVPEDPAALT